MRLVQVINLPAFGIIPTFINPADPRRMSEQINDQYISGWNDFKGFTIVSAGDSTYRLEYKGDPPMRELGRIYIGTEILAIFEGGWCLNALMDLEHFIKTNQMVIKLETATIARID